MAAWVDSVSTWVPPESFAAGLRERYGMHCPPRWGLPRRPEFRTYGPAVGRVMTALGFPPMPHQQYIADVALELDPVTGRFAYREVGLSIPRQQGKTAQLLGVCVHRLMAWDRQNVRYAAQTASDARSRFLDEFVAQLEDSALAGKFVTWRLTNRERLVWRGTNSRMAPVANTEKAGHGPPLDLGVADEIFAHEDDRIEAAFVPAMLSRSMAQFWWASAAGTERSAYLNGKRALGRELVEQAWAGGDWPTMFYAEWYPPAELADSDPAAWRAAMPALCPAPPCRCDPAGVWRHTVTLTTVAADHGRMKTKPAEFARGYLNRSRRNVPPVDPNVPTKEWPARADPTSRPRRGLSFGVDITPDRQWSSIAVYSPRPGRPAHVEVVDHRAGTAWLADAVARLRKIHHPVAIGADAPARSPAGGLLEDLALVGITVPVDPKQPRVGDLWVPTLAELVTACGQMAEAVRRAQLVHPDQPEQNAALAGCQSRMVGDGGFAWARRSALVVISPWYALTLARAAHLARVDVALPEEGEPGGWWVYPAASDRR